MPRSKSPAQAFPPGDFIREELEARGWTQRDLAEIIGRPVQAISAIVNGRRGVTPETAVALGAAFGTSPDFWLNLESAYRLDKAGPADPGIEIRARQWSKTRTAQR
ncbi:MAG TPA: HigA family addiction module antitoxin [Isosphaeraceae bacterium]|nr:HigA family addiction module antitoxin [Isosphaeraceae bacterium]